MKRSPVQCMVTVALLLATLHCGDSKSLVEQHAAWPGSLATGSLMVGDAPFCSATLVAPDVVVTSGRCARAALVSDSTFRWRHGALQFDTAIRHGHALKHDGTLTQPNPRWRPAGASKEARAAVRAIESYCHVDDMFALHRGRGLRHCLDGLAPSLLKMAGALGLAQWQDVGWLGLEDAVPTEPATVATQDASDVLQSDAHLRRIGVREARGLRASPLQRYEHRYQLYESNTTELHAGPERSLAHPDLGGGLWMETFASGTQAWLLVGVASRPFVAHSDTSAGLVFSRLDAHASAMVEAVSQLGAASVE